ncbi:MAG TPA: TerB family tellurite resistance protein [Polyangiaceae bacterium]|nr:TerB family tellurite resistance protein [Polyangiaceae bacterium]
MFFRRSSAPAAPAGPAELEHIVRTELAGADAETVAIVTAIAGLLVSVARADRDYSEPEQARLRAELERVQGLSPAGVKTLLAALERHAVEVSATQVQRYTRALRDHADRELRVVVLDALLDVAAADGTISLEEVTALRQISHGMGLTQADYNAAQERHRDKLSFLK